MGDLLTTLCSRKSCCSQSQQQHGSNRSPPKFLGQAGVLLRVVLGSLAQEALDGNTPPAPAPPPSPC